MSYHGMAQWAWCCNAFGLQGCIISALEDTILAQFMSTWVAIALRAPDDIKDRNGNPTHGAGNLRILSQRVQEVFSLNFPVACVSLREWLLERPVTAEETELKLSLEDTERIPPLRIFTGFLS